MLIMGKILERSLGDTKLNSIKSGSLYASGQFSLVIVPLTAKIFDS